MLPWLLREWRLLHTYVGAASALALVGVGGIGSGVLRAREVEMSFGPWASGLS